MPSDHVFQTVLQFFQDPQSDLNWLHFVIIFGLAFLVIHLFNWAIDAATPKVSQSINKRAEKESTSENFIRVRRLETYLSLGLTILRVIVIVGAFFLAWRLTNPGNFSIALVGASAIFIVLANSTFAPLLRDITYGFVMVAEHWFNVGDHVVVEPFAHMGGVVEKVTLRATKLRSVTGEAIWVHNQHMQAARVTSNASHTIAIETFVNDPKRGRKIIEQATEIIPTGPTTLPGKLAISEVKKIRDGVWRITAICQITPYREWVVDNFGIKVIKKTDELDGNNTIVYGPVAYYADSTAEKRFRRAVRARKQTTGIASTEQ
jgi:hypothetical protein